MLRAWLSQVFEAVAAMQKCFMESRVQFMQYRVFVLVTVFSGGVWMRELLLQVNVDFAYYCFRLLWGAIPSNLL